MNEARSILSWRKQKTCNKSAVKEYLPPNCKRFVPRIVFREIRLPVLSAQVGSGLMLSKHEAQQNGKRWFLFPRLPTGSRLGYSRKMTQGKLIIRRNAVHEAAVSTIRATNIVTHAFGGPLSPLLLLAEGAAFWALYMQSNSEKVCNFVNCYNENKKQYPAMPCPSRLIFALPPPPPPPEHLLPVWNSLPRTPLPKAE